MHASRCLSTTLVILVGAVLLVAGCAASSTSPSSAPMASSAAAASSGAASIAAPTAAQEKASPSATLAETPSPVTTPPTAVQHPVIGSGTYPAFTVVTPAGWNVGNGPFVDKNATGGGLLAVSVWDVGQVPRDPCHWSTTLRTPGPGVDALVRALASQTRRRATTPVKASLAGQSGEYLAWSVPKWDVTGESDFAGCDEAPSGEPQHPFESWFSNGGGDRWEQVAGQVDRLWVLDVSGQRLVVDATYTPDTTSADRAELESVVKSLRFVTP